MENKKTEKIRQNERRNADCKDRVCPVHGCISLRGRRFKGYVKRKFPKRVAIEFERTVYIKKYERYAKRNGR